MYVSAGVITKPEKKEYSDYFEVRYNANFQLNNKNYAILFCKSHNNSGCITNCSKLAPFGRHVHPSWYMTNSTHFEEPEKGVCNRCRAWWKKCNCEIPCIWGPLTVLKADGD